MLDWLYYCVRLGVEILRRIKMGQPKLTKQWLEYVATSKKPNDDTRCWTVNYDMLYYPVPSLVFCLRFLTSPSLSPTFFFKSVVWHYIWSQIYVCGECGRIFFFQCEVFWRPNTAKQLQINPSCIVFAQRWRNHINLNLNARIKPFYISLGIYGAKGHFNLIYGNKNCIL